MKFYNAGSKIVSLENVRSIEQKNKKVVIRYTDNCTETIKTSSRENAQVTFLSLQACIK